MPGKTTKLWAYTAKDAAGNEIINPTIVQQRGRRSVVRFINELPMEAPRSTSTHLHGSASLPQYDGYANDRSWAGQYKDYVYPNFQNARTIWYHDHGLHYTGPNVYLGMAGFYLLKDDADPDQQLLPQGEYDVPLVLRDAQLDSNGDFVWNDNNLSSVHGDVILTNGVPWPRMAVKRGMYRFRILNGSISRGYRLSLSSGSFYVIGTDAGLLPTPVKTNDLRIGMAERYEILIDFNQYPAGTKVVLKNLGVPNSKQFTTTAQVLRFDVDSASPPVTTSAFNASTRFNASKEVNDVMALTEAQALNKRLFRLEHEADGMWTLNDKTWDPDRVDANPRLGTVERWTIQNKSGGWFHPFHIHLIDFKILRRNGSTTAVRAYEKGAKDVVYVGENETVDLLIKFGPHRGKYMMHCHNLVHEDHDMMTQFEVMGPNGEANVNIPRPDYVAPPEEWYEGCPNPWEKGL